MNKTEIRKHVRDAYGDAVRQRTAASCCAPNPALYAAEDLHQIPEDAAGSTGRCNTCIKCFCRSCELQRLAWPLIELPSNRVQMFL